MIVVEQLPAGPPPTGSIADAVELTWEQRQKTRQILTTQAGREIGIKLPTGTRLAPGCVAYVGDGYHVTVVAAAEDVWIVPCADRLSLARVAYELGQRHLPVELDGDRVAVGYDHTLEELWRRLGVRGLRRRQPFLAEPAHSHHHAR